MVPDIYPILSNNSAVAALLCDSSICRIVPFGEAQEKIDYPYVTWFVPDGTPWNTLAKVPQGDELLTQVDIWGKTAASALDVAAAVRDALEPHAHMIGVGSMQKDPDTKTYRVRLDFNFFTER